MSKTGKASKRQAEALAFIRSYRKEHDFSPTLAEVAGSLGVTITTAFQHVDALVRKGLLSRGKTGGARTWVPVD